ncbi:amidohydrolase family protein [Streptomyces sp. NPDC056190]|uniref:amidohydrolase family protein n=1 Tax=Streptomyces sp. NPDC056190 TaxID=3345741 RepID=UPI0035DE25CF
MSTTTLVHGGPVLDVRRGTWREGAAVVVEDGRVTEIVGRDAVPHETGAEIVDTDGGHILPGLIDAHAHLMSRSGVEADADLITRSVVDGVITARRFIESGITTVRDPGCKHRGIHALRAELAAGRVLGPRAFTAGPNVVGSGAPVDWRNVFADGPDAVRRAVRLERLAGADFIKLVLSHTTADSDWTLCLRYLNDEEIATAVSEAHLLGARVGCHCEGIDAARGAVAAGVDVIDHGLTIDAPLAARMAAQGTVYVPTLWAFRTKTHLNVGKTITEDQAAVYEERIGAVHEQSVRYAVEAGVTIAAGSDPIHWIPARDVLICELEALTEAGLSAADALRAATLGSATALGEQDNLGSLEPGYRADVLVVDGDPLADLRALGRPRLVMRDGRVLVDLRDDKAAAEALWADITTGEPASERQPEIWLRRD